MTNLAGIVDANKNAASTAMERGVKDNKKRDISCNDVTPKRRANAMSLYAKDDHKRTARAVGYALTIGDFDGWHDLGKVLQARLEPAEIGGIAYAAMSALGADLSAEVYNAAYGGSGMPIAPLFNHMDEAAFWADTAAPAEIEAYCFASFNAMHPTRQAAFLSFVQGRAVA